MKRWMYPFVLAGIVVLFLLLFGCDGQGDVAAGDVVAGDVVAGQGDASLRTQYPYTVSGLQSGAYGGRLGIVSTDGTVNGWIRVASTVDVLEPMERRGGSNRTVERSQTEEMRGR